MVCVFDTSWGRFRANVVDDHLVELKRRSEDLIPASHPVHRQVRDQLQAYFDGSLRRFDLPIHLESDSKFHLSVWKRLLDIPYGQVKSYKDIALELDKLGAERAVGTANAKNPIAIVVPCHRVLGSGGKLGGYFYGVEMKRKLLELESASRGPDLFSFSDNQPSV